MIFTLTGASETGVFDEKSPSGNDYLSEVLITGTHFLPVWFMKYGNTFAPVIKYVHVCVLRFAENGKEPR